MKKHLHLVVAVVIATATLGAATFAVAGKTGNPCCVKALACCAASRGCCR